MSEHSPYIAAALASKPTLAPLQKVGEQSIPHPTSQEARDLLYVDPFAEVSNTPRKPLQLVGQPLPDLSYQEMLALTRQYEEKEKMAQAARVNAAALWAAQLGGDAPDALETALIRIDKLEERMRRFRVATGLSREALARRGDKWITISNRVPESLRRRTEAAAASRGEKVAQTERFLLECGLIMLDERARRYEVWVLQQLQAVATQAAANEAEASLKVEAVAEVFAEIEVDRYVDVQRVGFERAVLTLDPLHGAPPAVRELLRPGDAPRALSA